jgi:hypothetical protein
MWNIFCVLLLINLPTAHIWSRNGKTYPYMGEGLILGCRKQMREEVINRVGYPVPGVFSAVVLSDPIPAFERTVELVEMLSERTAPYE